MVFQNNLREISKIIYRLKRNYGLGMTIWHPDTITQDILTGEVVRSYTTQYVRRGVMLPSRLVRDFVYDLAYIAAAKNFTYGAYFDPTRRFVLIDAKDLTSGFEFTPQDYIAFQNEWYNIIEVHEAENRKAWMLIVKTLSNTDVPAPYNLIQNPSDVALSQNITGDYYTNGQYNSVAAYQTLRGTWWLWYSTGAVLWYISQTKGTLVGEYWVSNDATITGLYLPQNGATGSAILSAN